METPLITCLIERSVGVEVVEAAKLAGAIRVPVTLTSLPHPMECYIVGLGLDCKFIDLLIKRSINIFIKISLYLNFIVLEIISKQTDTLI